MLKKNRGIVYTISGSLLVLSLILGTLFLKPDKVKLTRIPYGEVEVVINKEFKFDFFEEKLYVYIPINTDLSDVDAIITIDGTVIDEDNFRNYLMSVDTFTPGELTYTYVNGEEEGVIHIIIE